MTVGQLGMKHPSLAGMVEAIKAGISREGMHRRFSETAAAFMKRCADYILKQKISAIIPLKSNLLEHFKRILIFDSTSWDIHPNLRNVLPGSGGMASDANCKLQACYEYKCGELRFFEIQPGIAPDSAYTSQLHSPITAWGLDSDRSGLFQHKNVSPDNRDRGVFSFTAVCRYRIVLSGDIHAC